MRVCVLHAGKTIKACFGTTKYCNAFLKGVPCNNHDCLYLHDIGELPVWLVQSGWGVHHQGSGWLRHHQGSGSGGGVAGLLGQDRACSVAVVVAAEAALF